MGFLSALVGIKNAEDERVDPPRADGTRGPFMLKLGAGVLSSAVENGGTTDVTLAIDPAFVAEAAEGAGGAVDTIPDLRALVAADRTDKQRRTVGEDDEGVPFNAVFKELDGDDEPDDGRNVFLPNDLIVSQPGRWYRDPQVVTPTRHGVQSPTDKLKQDSQVHLIDHGWTSATTDAEPMFTDAAAALPSTGGTIHVPDNADIPLSQVTFTKRITIRGGRSYTALDSIMFQTNANLSIVGVGENETKLNVLSAGTGIRLTGTWSYTPEGSANIHLSRVQFNGGAKHIDATGLTGFYEGNFVVEDCTFQSSTGVSVTLPNSFYYGQFARCQWNLCYSFATIGQNTETLFNDCIFKVSGTGGAGITLNGPHHVGFHACEFYGLPPNVNPDVLIVSVDDCANGYVYFDHRCKFGGEREYWHRNDRHRIVIDGTTGGGLADTTVCLHVSNSEFFGPNVLAIASIGITGNVCTATVTCNGSYGHGFQVGDRILVQQVVTHTECNGEFEVTAVGTAGASQTVSWALTDSDFGPTALGGVIGSLSTSAIKLTSAIADSVVHGCFFQGYGYACDDDYYAKENPRDLSGRNKWTANRVRGPIGRGGQTFKLGGHSFDLIDAEENDDVNLDIHDEPIELRNRFAHSEDVDQWPVLGDITFDTLEADPWGGTRAVKIIRGGSAQFHTEGAEHVWTLAEGAARAISLTDITNVVYLKFWAKAGTLTTLSMAILNGDGYSYFSRNFKLTSTWKQYRCRIVLSDPIPPVLQMNATPGGEDPESGTVYVTAFQLDDHNGNYLLTTSAAAVDTTVGYSFDRTVKMYSLTASTAVVTDSSKRLASLAYATAATANTLVQRDASGGILVDDLGAASVNVSGLTASYAVVTDGSKNLASLAYASAATASALVQRDGSGISAFSGVTTPVVDSAAGLAVGGTNATSLALGRAGISTTTTRDVNLYVNPSFAADANFTASSGETDASVWKVTSAVTLTNTRVILVPPVVGLVRVITNATTGAQSITIYESPGAAGLGVTIPNGKTGVVYWNGTDHIGGYLT